MEEIFKELHDIRDRPVPADELGLAKLDSGGHLVK
jgi:hypothetical protein